MIFNDSSREQTCSRVILIPFVIWRKDYNCDCFLNVDRISTKICVSITLVIETHLASAFPHSWIMSSADSFFLCVCVGAKFCAGISTPVGDWSLQEAWVIDWPSEAPSSLPSPLTYLALTHKSLKCLAGAPVLTQSWFNARFCVRTPPSSSSLHSRSS